MKYMTKEWYETMQKTGIHSVLEIDERADKFSEDLYQELYEKGKMKHINFFNVPDNFEQFTEKYNKLGNIHEENLKAMYDKLVEELQRFTSDDYYSELLENKVKELKEKLTSEILNNVKDIRILALNYTTKEIYERIKEYCDNNRKYVEKMREDYDKILLEQFKDNLHAFVTEGFHDCDIKKSKIINNDLILELDNSGGFSDINVVIFKNAKILKQDCNLENVWWLYQELYKVDDKYEVHILLRDEKKLYDLILTCDDIVLEK